jgi:hypothetical protein
MREISTHLSLNEPPFVTVPNFGDFDCDMPVGSSPTADINIDYLFCRFPFLFEAVEKECNNSRDFS